MALTEEIVMVLVMAASLALGVGLFWLGIRQDKREADEENQSGRDDN